LNKHHGRRPQPKEKQDIHPETSCFSFIHMYVASPPPPQVVNEEKEKTKKKKENKREEEGLCAATGRLVCNTDRNRVPP
jgi:hypothetical protein